MYAVIEVGGKQYRVEPGMDLTHEVVPGLDVGDEITFDRVLLIRNGSGVRIGHPHIEKARVVGSVEEIGRRAKVVVQRFKAKKGYRRKKGFRQPYMRTRVVSIEKE